MFITTSSLYDKLLITVIIVYVVKHIQKIGQRKTNLGRFPLLILLLSAGRLVGNGYSTEL